MTRRSDVRVWVFGVFVFLTACSGGSAPPPPPSPQAVESAPMPTDGSEDGSESGSESLAEPPTVRTDPEPIQEVPTLDAPSSLLPTVDVAALDTVEAGPFDNGKMWTFEYPPTEYLADTYGLRPDSEWYARARLGALRIPNCSASFVSPRGLVMTNHHCAREFVVQVSEEGEGLLDNGFLARSIDEERPLEEFEADQLIEIVDVTEVVDAELGAIVDPAARTARREAFSEELAERMALERGGEEAGVVVEVISLWNGARTSAYVFHRYENAKLVMAPELQIGFFGGDPDNFTYPRYNLDFAFLRIYGNDGEPIETEHYFEWSEEGVEEGDLIFIIGNPGSTTRLQTMAQLAFRREVEDPAILRFLDTRIEVLEAYLEAYPEDAERLDIRNDVFSLLNSQKAFRGILDGLSDPVLMARRADTEADFVEAIAADVDLQTEFGALIDRIAAIQTEKAAIEPDLWGFAVLGNPDFSAAALIRGIWGLQYASAQSQGAPADALDGIREQLAAVPDQPVELQIALLTARLADFQEFFSDDPGISGFLAGRDPAVVARSVIESTALADSAGAMAAIEAGSVGMDDAALQLTLAYLQRFFTFQGEVTRIDDEERDAAAQLGRARFAVYGTSIPPDATFSLRIADGVVSPYDYNGTRAPVHTTFFGLYDRFHSFAGDEAWDLPERWRNPPEGLDLSTPINFISTADIIGGNSGSPVLNRDLEVVGLVFDGNIESLPGDYIYVDTANRAVSVDARGILEALDEIYDLDRIVLELTTGELFRTEADADAAGGS